MAELFNIHNAEFVGVDCLTGGSQYCVVRGGRNSVNFMVNNTMILYLVDGLSCSFGLTCSQVICN